jgi:hypothetical protein
MTEFLINIITRTYMKKILSALLLVTSTAHLSSASERLLRGPAVEVSFDAGFQQAVQRHHPEDFEGMEHMNKETITAYRSSQAQFTGKQMDVFYALHNPNLIPLLRKLEDHMNYQAAWNPNQKRPIGKLLTEIRFHRDMEEISPLWFLGMHFRFATATSTIREDERELFAHVPHPEVYEGLVTGNAWNGLLTSMVSMGAYENEGLELRQDYPSTQIMGKGLNKVIQHLARALPDSIQVPMVGCGKFGVSFMVKCFLDRISPLAFSNQELEGHGVKFSHLGMPLHDALHDKVDRRVYNLTKHVIKRADTFIATGGDAWNFAEIYPPIAVQKFQAVMGALEKIYGDFHTKLLVYRGLHDYRKAMVGFIWAAHEAPHFPAKLYNMNDLGQIIDTITSHSPMSAVNAAVDEYDSWESSFDPLNTSPLDGSSSLSDDELYYHVLQSRAIEDAQIYKFTLNVRTKTPIYEEGIGASQIVRGKRFIDVSFEMKNGEELKYSYPTLYHKWLNMNDNIGLLAYGGTLIEKPELSCVEDPRTLALAKLDEVSHGIAAHVKFFREVAHFFSNYELRNQTSLGKRFFFDFTKREQKVIKDLNDSFYCSDSDCSDCE